VWAPVSKNRVSASYVLISLGASTLLFGQFNLLCGRRGLSFKVFEVWGQTLPAFVRAPPDSAGIDRPAALAFLECGFLSFY